MLLLVSWPLLQHLLSLFRGVRRCLDASEPSNGTRDMSSANDLQHPQKIQHFLTGPVSQQRLSLFFSARLLWILFLCFERAEHTVPFCQNSPSKNIQIFIFFWVPLSSNAMSSSPTHHTWWSLRVPRALLRHDVQVHLSKSRHQRHSKTIKHIQKHKKTLFHSRTICVSKYVSRSNKIFCATREPIIHPIAFMVWRKSSCPQVVTTSA